MPSLETILFAVGRLLLKIIPLPSRKYNHFFDRMDVGFMICNNSGLIIRVNDAFASHLGYTRGQMEGRRFLKFVHDGDVHDTIEAMETLTSGGNVHGFKNRYHCRDGSTKVLTWYCSSNGLIYGMAFIEEELQ